MEAFFISDQPAIDIDKTTMKHTSAKTSSPALSPLSSMKMTNAE